MDWLQFISSIVGSLAWPSAVVALAVLLRQPLAKLIPMIRSLKYKDLQIDLGEQLAVVQENVEAAGEEPVKPSEQLPPSFQTLADIDPRAAILSAWLPVESKLNEIGEQLSRHPETDLRKGSIRLAVSDMDIVNSLWGKGLVDQVTVGAILRLRRIRNDAVHLSEKDITSQDALQMASMCDWVLTQLSKIKFPS